MRKTDETARSGDISATFAKGLAVLKAFDAEHCDLGFSDIARLCNLDRAVARRLMLTLEHLGYVRRSGRTFALTPKVLVLAGGYLQSRRFGKFIQPIVETHTRALGETISLAVLEDDTAIYVAQAAVDPTRISFGFTVGSRLPLLHSAIGRALLSGCTPQRSTDYINSLPLVRHTPESLMDRDAIVAEIETARLKGLAAVRGEFEPDVTGFAVPLPPSHNMVFAVGTSVRADALDENRETLIVRTLRDCAVDLSGVV